MRAQASFEFMVMTGLVLLVFSAASFMAFLFSQEAETKQDKLEANAVCLEVSSILSSIASLPGNSVYSFWLPAQINGKQYTVRIVSQSRLVKVDYSTYGVGCRLAASSITNSSGAGNFILRRDATATGNNGVIVIAP